MTVVADEDDRVALRRELASLDVDLGDERARRIDRAQVAHGGVLVHRRGDAVGAEDDEGALGNLGLLLDEDRAALAQLLDDVLVVDDLLADVDGRAVDVERVLDRLHGAVDPGAVTARGRQEDARGRVQLGGRHAHRVEIRPARQAIGRAPRDRPRIAVPAPDR